MTDNKTIRTNMIWNVTGSMAFVGCQWMMTILIVRLSGFQDAGWLSLGLSLTNIFTNIVYFGIRNFQVSDTKEKYSSSDYVNQRLVMALSALIIYIIFVMSNRYPHKEAVFLILFMVYRMSEPLADVFHGIDQKHWRLDYAGKSFLLRGILALLAFVVGLIIWKDLLITTVIMIFAAYSVLLIYDVKRAYSLSPFSLSAFNFSPMGLKENIIKLTLECLPLFGYAICLNSVVPIPRYFLEKAAGSEILGCYASVAVPASIIQMFSSYVYTSFTGLFTKYSTERDKKSFIILALKLMGVIAFFGALACFICSMSSAFLPGGKGQNIGSWVLTLIFTQDVAPYTYLLVPTIAVCILIAFTWFFGTLLTVLRDMRALIIGSIAGVLVVIPSAFTLINSLGADGVNPAVALSNVVTLVIFLFCLIRDLNCL